MGSLTQLTGLRDCHVAVDLGSTNTLMYVRGRGVRLAERSLVAVEPATSKARAFGIDAERLLEREAASVSGVAPLWEAGSVTGVAPVRHGVITDLELVVQMLRRFSRQACGRRRAHPQMVVAVPIGATGVSRRALREACHSAGAAGTCLIEAPMAAAIGAGLPVAEAVGSLVIDIGGGITEVGLISLGATVTCRSIPVGGEDFDQAIIKHLKRENGLRISPRAAEELKRRIGSVWPSRDRAQAEVSGHDTRSRSPRTAVVTSEEIRAALESPVSRIVEAVTDTLGRTPPELASDVLERGTVLAGGGALMKGLDERIRDETQMPAQVAEMPLTCAVTGAGAWLEELNDGRFQEVTESWRYYRQVPVG
jgi:rod shape-determining protein MreB and related proteins